MCSELDAILTRIKSSQVCVVTSWVDDAEHVMVEPGAHAVKPHDPSGQLAAASNQPAEVDQLRQGPAAAASTDFAFSCRDTEIRVWRFQRRRGGDCGAERKRVVGGERPARNSQCRRRARRN
jgi:hypothetical protein